MIFVGNDGCLQIHTGPVFRLEEFGSWFNVLDPDFNLHLRMEGITSCWAVRKPSADGDIHSIEAFDRVGNLIIQLFGARKPGKPELPAWTELTRSLQSV